MASPHLLRAFLVCTPGLLATAARAQDDPADLADKKFEDLMNIEVTSTSKTEQKLSETPSAIFVITQEDIRNSGANDAHQSARPLRGGELSAAYPGEHGVKAISNRAEVIPR
jgi:iron complex outermembrane receptor protein